jgi:hypothetical protein
MIIYTGNGPLVFVGLLIVFGVFVPVVVFTQWLGTHPALSVLRMLGFLVGCGIAGQWCWRSGRKWNKDGNLHTVYDIPFQHFAFVYWGFGLIMAIWVTVGWINRPVEPGQVPPSIDSASADSWTTYTSPDARVRFDYPSSMKIIVRPRKDADDPHLGLSAVTPDESIQLTLLLRLSDDPMPGYCERMLDTLVNADTKAVTKRQDISLGNGRGFRQEFREEMRGQAPVEYIAVALEARPAYVHFTCGYTVSSKAEHRPVCE